MKPFTLVEVVWDDIVIDNAWTSTSKANKKTPERFRTVGWYLSQDDRSLRTVATRQMHKDKAVNDVSVFPLGCVISVTPL